MLERLRKLFFRPTLPYWTCPDCHAFVYKDKANYSGGRDFPHGLHVHCPICGSIVVEFLEPNSDR